MISIPLAPSWPRMLANIAVWSTAWAIIFTTISAIKRTRRLAAGHCTRCKYDARGLPICPECGSPQHPSAIGATS